MTTYMQTKELEKDMKKNPEKYIGQLLATKDGCVYRVTGITKKGIDAKMIMSHNKKKGVIVS